MLTQSPILNPKLISPYAIGASPTAARIPTEWYHKRKTHISISGPRYTSKSVSAATLIVLACITCPGLQVCAVRKEAATIYNTLIVPVFDDDIFAGGLYATPGIKFNKSRYEIEFDNGSRIVFGGFGGGSSASGKVLGGKWDIVWYNQIERENDIKNHADLIGCMVEGRAGHLFIAGRPHFLFIGDLNPTTPHHWWYKKKFDENMLWYDLFHVDHPLFRDFETGELNERGERLRYQLKLDTPEGYLQDRMVDGLFVGASGRVYPMITEENFREVDRSEIPSDWEWVCGIDYGYNDPCVADYWAFSPDNTEAIFYKSIYKSEILTDTFVDYIKELEHKESINPIWRVADHDKRASKDMQWAGIESLPCIKNDIPSDIEHCRRNLQKMDITFNTKMLFRGECQHRINRNKCTDAMQEILSYVHKEEDKMKGDGKDDYPADDQDDHSMDTMKYIFRERIIEKPQSQDYYQFGQASMPSLR